MRLSDFRNGLFILAVSIVVSTYRNEDARVHLRTHRAEGLTYAAAPTPSGVFVPSSWSGYQAPEFSKQVPYLDSLYDIGYHHTVDFEGQSTTTKFDFEVFRTYGN